MYVLKISSFRSKIMSDFQLSLKQKMQELASAIAKECMKYYTPSKVSKKETGDMLPAANVACLRVIKFRQQYPFGLLGVIQLVKIIRKQFKQLSYDVDFVNTLTIHIIRALLRMQVKPQPLN